MDKIEIGEYVRTSDGIIGKLIKIERDDIDTSLKWYVFNDGKNERYINKPYIVKHSKNLIDLIEYGDIVEYIDDLEDNNEYIKSFIVTKTELQLKAFKEYLKSYCKIISILTKQQYEQNCYVVESEVKDE